MNANNQRERAKHMADQRKVERKSRKRHCVLCGIEESEKTPFMAHPDGIGPCCRETMACNQHAAATKFVRG